MKKAASNVDTVLRPELCILGAGPAGLSLASAGALLGVSVVLVNTGVHETEADDLAAAALRASASRAQTLRDGFGFGIGHRGVEPAIDFSALQTHQKQAIARSARTTSLDRYKAMGVRVIEGAAQFVDPETVMTGVKTIKARRFVIAAGSRPEIPEISGIETVPYRTARTILDLAELPRHLLVLGGGHEAVSLAQAYGRLGARVTLIAGENALLADEDQEIVSALARALRREGIDLRLGTKISAIEKRADGSIVVQSADGPDLEGSHLLVASGRIPDLEGLNLKAGRIRVESAGIVVDRHMRSSNAKVYAIGHPQQSATRQAGIAFRNAVLRLPTRFDPASVPRLVHCEPELAAVGLTEEDARAKFREIRVLRAPFTDNDRAIAEHATDGHIKVVTTTSGRVLGCSILGPRAHDLILPWSLAMANGLTASDLAEIAPPGPAFSGITRDVALEFVKLSVQAPWLLRALGFLRRWG